jgi:hypothetical protein
MRTLVCIVIAATAALATARADPRIDRGKYLVTLGGCNDCHTPGYFVGKPDMTRYLGGSDVGLEIRFRCKFSISDLFGLVQAV